QTAFAFLPGGLLIAIGAPRIGAVITRFGPPTTLAIGMLAFAFGYLLFLRIGDEISYFAVMLPTMLLLGVGFICGYPAANVLATSGVAEAQQGLAGGLVTPSFQLGGALALAIASAIISAGDGGTSAAAATIGAFRAALLVIAGTSLVGFAIAIF